MPSTAPTPQPEIRELTLAETDHTTGGAFWAGVAAGLVANAIYQMVTTPSTQTIPEFLGHLK